MRSHQPSGIPSTRSLTALALSTAMLAALSGCAPVLLHLSMGSERGRGHLREETVVVDGTHIVMTARQGDGDGPTAILIHGFGGDKDNWTRMAARLPASWNLMIPDLAGFGESEKRPDNRHDVVAQVERIHRLVQMAPSRPVILVGNSMGGHIAAATAILHPEDVSALVLVDAAGVQSPVPSEVRLAMARGENPLLTNSVDDFDRVMGLMFVTTPEIPDVVKSHFAQRAAAARPFNDRIFREMAAAPFPLETRLKDIKAPTLVIWGAEDKVLHHSAGPIFAAGIPDARLVTMANTGHIPMLEYPVETARIISNFVGVGQ